MIHGVKSSFRHGNSLLALTKPIKNKMLASNENPLLSSPEETISDIDSYLSPGKDEINEFKEIEIESCDDIEDSLHCGHFEETRVVHDEASKGSSDAPYYKCGSIMETTMKGERTRASFRFDNLMHNFNSLQSRKHSRV